MNFYDAEYLPVESKVDKRETNLPQGCLLVWDRVKVFDTEISSDIIK